LARGGTASDDTGGEELTLGPLPEDRISLQQESCSIT